MSALHGEAFDSGEAVEAGVEGQDLVDVVLLHYGQVDGVAGGHLFVAQNNLFGALGCGVVDREDLVDDAEQGVEGWLDGVTAVDGGVAVEDFLEDFGVGYQALAVADQFFQQLLRVGFVWVGRTDQVHRDIGVDQKHGCMPVAYPRSISASMVLILAVG